MAGAFGPNFAAYQSSFMERSIKCGDEGQEVDSSSSIADEGWHRKVDALFAHPFFMKECPDRKVVESNEHLKALQTLLYEGSSEEIAENFKNQGNACYRIGKTRYKDALTFYTKGLDMKCANNALNSVLYSNRAAIHLELGNFRKAIEDCLDAIQLDPIMIKAHYRAACAYSAIDQWALALEHIQKAIPLDPSNKALTAQKDIIMAKKKQLERKISEKADLALSKQANFTKLMLAIKVSTLHI
jgi:tetratricopeptide (TPR) repeat protein